MTKLILLFAALVTAAVLVGPGLAKAGQKAHENHFGPYPSTTTDSGTCGIDWATDNVNRYFKIKQTGPTSYDVTEKYKHGTFSTFAVPMAPSPGACDSSDGTGPGTVAPDVTGKFHGYDRIAITNAATYTPASAACASPCASTNQFLVSVFPTGFVRDDYAFSFNYEAAPHQGLIYHHWRNASCNRGGNHGDIQSASGVFAETASC
jgi:hypothetical protein